MTFERPHARPRAKLGAKTRAGPVRRWQSPEPTMTSTAPPSRSRFSCPAPASLAQGAPADPRAALRKRAEGDTPLIADTFELVTGSAAASPGACDGPRSARGATEKLKAAGRGTRSIPRASPSRSSGSGHGGGRRDCPRVLPPPGGRRPGHRLHPGRHRDQVVVDVGAGARRRTGRRPGAATSGAIALVHTKEMKTFEDLFEGEHAAGPTDEGRRPGARSEGLLIQSTRPRGLLYQHPMVFGPLAGNRAGGPRLARAGRAAGAARDRTEVRVRMDVVNRIDPMFDGQNVVVNIGGRRSPRRSWSSEPTSTAGRSGPGPRTTG